MTLRLALSLLVLSVLCADAADALPPQIALDSELQSRLKPISTLNRFGFKASCLRYSAAKVVVGVVKGAVFTPLKPKAVGQEQRRAFTKRLAQAQLRCLELMPGVKTDVAPSVPELAKWESDMIVHGRQHCQALTDPTFSFDEKLAATYYDAEWVFRQIAAYTGDPGWRECAARARQIYGDQYVVPDGGAVPGYWNFTHGLTEAALTEGDPAARDAVFKLAHFAAYANDETPLSETRSSEFSREVAYTIMAYLNAERLGEGRRPRLAGLVNQALGHLNQWFVSESAPYVRPFMVGLTAHALISYAEASGDPRVLPALRIAADWLWEHTWLRSSQAFMYTDRETDSGGREPAPDLNQLIAPLYAWLYSRTGEAVYLERGDRVFAGGVKFAFLENGKHFNQNYRWSFAYVAWRRQALATN